MAEAAGAVDYKTYIKTLNTHSRLIEHTERIEPKDYKSTLGATYVDPRAHKGE
jgi:hypothetical protein